MGGPIGGPMGGGLTTEDSREDASTRHWPGTSLVGSWRHHPSHWSWWRRHLVLEKRPWDTSHEFQLQQQSVLSFGRHWTRCGVCGAKDPHPWGLHCFHTHQFSVT